MEVTVLLNGEPFVLAERSNLSFIVKQLGLEGKRYAVEVNEEIIPRSEHASFALSPGDRIEVVQAIGGG